MKSLLIFFWCAVTTLHVQAQEALRIDLRSELVVARIPQKRAIKLQQKFRAAGEAENAYADLLKMLQANEAKLVDWPLLTSSNGHRAVSENVQEIRYPVEFEPPRVVQNPAGGAVAFTANPSAPDKPPDPNKADAAGSPGRVSSKAPVLAAIPSTFDMRHVGVTLEIETVSHDEKSITAQVSAKHTTLLGYHRQKVETEGKHSVVIEQPKFHEVRTSASLSLKSGVPHLLSFHKLEHLEGVIEVAVLTVTIVSP